MASDKKVLLLCKETLYCDYAIKICQSHFNSDEFQVERGKVGQPINDEMELVRPQYILSFLSPWIINESLIKSAKLGALNFHPGSPMYPGIGCYNFALYENAEKYGVTCHYMKPKVDTGEIITTSYFYVGKNDTVETLKLKSMNHLLLLFDNIISLIAKGLPMPKSDEIWLRKPFTRKQLNELCFIDPHTQTQEEIARRIRAVSYPSLSENYGAYTELGGHRFYCETERRDPIA